MLCKISLLAALLPVAMGISNLQISSNPTSQGSITITWSADPTTDPAVFSIYLFNPVFNDNFGIANDVDPAAQTITLTLPVVPAGDGYTLEAVNVGNVNQAYATSGDFAIGAVTSSSSSGSSTAASGSSTSSGTGTSTSTTTGSQLTSTTLSTTKASTSGSKTSTGTSAGSASSTPSSFNSAGIVNLPLGISNGGLVAFAASVAAGAAMIAF